MHVVEEDHELVAASARDRVGLADAGPDPGRDATQESVPVAVPDGVVDLLESIEIEEQERRSLAAPAALREQLAEPLSIQPNVRQAGERIVQRGAPFAPPSILDLARPAEALDRPQHGRREGRLPGARRAAGGHGLIDAAAHPTGARSGGGGRIDHDHGQVGKVRRKISPGSQGEHGGIERAGAAGNPVHSHDARAGRQIVAQHALDPVGHAGFSVDEQDARRPHGAWTIHRREAANPGERGVGSASSGPPPTPSCADPRAGIETRVRGSGPTRRATDRPGQTPHATRTALVTLSVLP